MTNTKDNNTGAAVIDPAESNNHNTADAPAPVPHVVEPPAGSPGPGAPAPSPSPEVELRVLPPPSDPAAPLTDQLPLVEFAEPFAAWLDREGSRKESSIEGIIKSLRRVQRAWFDFSTVPLKDLRKNHILDLNESLNNACAEASEENYSNDTKNACSSAVRQLLSYICDQLELFTDEKFERLARRLKFHQSNARVVELPTNEQIEVMRQYLRQSYQGRGRDWAQIIYMFEIYRMFSPRRGTVSGLKVWDLDFVNSRIRLRINKQRKGAGPRTVNLFMPASVKQALLEYVTRFNLRPHDRLFTVRDIRGSLKSAAVAAGLPNWYHHAFRKLTTIRMIEAGVPVPVIAAILGHRDNGATILRNYWSYCEAAMDAALQKYDAWCNGLPAANCAAELIRRKAALLDVLERVCAAPQDTAARITQFLLRIDEHLRAGRYGQALAAVPEPLPIALTDVATLEAPHIQCVVPEEECRTIANNFLYLMVSKGRGIHELSQELKISANALYFLRRGRGLSPAKLRAVEEHFGVPAGYLKDPAQPRADFALIRRNLQFIAARVGLRNLPCPDTLSEALDGQELPCGYGLRRLSEALPFLSIPRLMTVDIAGDAALAQAVEDFARTVTERKANIAAHIQMHYRLARRNGMQLAKATGLKSNQVHAYASGRQLAPEQKALKIAHALGLTLAELYRPAFQPDARAIGQRLAGWISAKGMTASVAAQKMQTSAKEFLQVLQGDRPPSARQIRKISAFFGRPLEEVLGMPDGSTGPATQTPAADQADAKTSPAK
jgi:transcriptional regulator with XRE-family HTH domain/integrase